MGVEILGGIGGFALGLVAATGLGLHSRKGRSRKHSHDAQIEFDPRKIDTGGRQATAIGGRAA